MSAGNMYIGGAVLSNEYHEDSRHVPGCPRYTKLKSHRRVGAQFSLGTWSRFSILVQASLSYTASCMTGAGGLSISPQLSFRMIVKETPAKDEIFEALLIYSRGQPSAEESAKTITIVERNIQKMFLDGKASLHDRFLGGQNLIHVSCVTTPFRDILPPLVLTNGISRWQYTSSLRIFQPSKQAPPL